MKKISLFVLAGLVAGNSAMALTREEACNQKQGMIWITKDGGDCISVNPCKNRQYDAYCIRAFAGTEVESADIAKALIKVYNKYHDLKLDKSVPEGTDINNAVLQDYLGYTNGEIYYQYEFGDTNDRWERTTEQSTFSAIEIAVNNNKKYKLKCERGRCFARVSDKAEASEAVCAEVLNDVLKPVLGRRYKLKDHPARWFWKEGTEQSKKELYAEGSKPEGWDEFGDYLGCVFNY